MKLTELYRDFHSKSINFRWTNFPPNTIIFRISIALQSNVSPEDYELVSETTDNWFVDYFNYSRAIEFPNFTYKIEALTVDNEVVDELVFQYQRFMHKVESKVYNTLRTKAQIILHNQYFKFDALLLKPKKSGKHCPVCYSENLEQSVNPECNVCYGTGYEGGFYTPIPISLIPLQEDSGISPINAPIPMAYDKVMAATASFPTVEQGDYVIVPETGIYLIENTKENTVMFKKTATNIIRMSLLDFSKPIYNYNYKITFTEVREVKYDKNDRELIIMGQNLIPYFGNFKIIIHYNNRDEYRIIKWKDIDIIKPDEIKIVNIDIPDNAGYWIKINGFKFNGIIKAI